MIYLDYAATTPIDEEALDVFSQASRKFFGNASSLHDIGSEAARLLDMSRQQLAEMLNIKKEGIIFTSGGSESNMLAIGTFIASKPSWQNHLIVSQTEHASLANFVEKLEQDGFEVTYLRHLKDGRVDIEHLQECMSERTCLVIVQHVNSEIGVIQPIEQISEIVRKHQAFFHVDCVQSFAKLPLGKIAASCDGLSVSSHKVYGPKGTGAVIFPAIHQLKASVPNITHEYGFRPGTVDVPGIASFVTAAKKLGDIMEDERKRISALRTQLIQRLTERKIDFQIIEAKYEQLPHILALTFAGLQGQYIMLELNQKGFAVSTGSACQIGKQDPSKTMMAIGKSEDEAHQFVRFSFGKNTTADDIHKLADCIEGIASIR
ncbi:IscS subfamily cysteine desulfurase [Peribacillus frigoritolerans]|uniref:IscS subfamily cysteine desulfurase n=1 Tax=Peribacillus frigoritolerans TaxID=450367 RepID=UPI002226D4B2|nr:IscS subfamily cysteine desulfurase [Peribacillus frigoritolerans]UYY97492.1 IscS subfamily cysteine desulfurase [Peribacillus frigoritolerans]